MCAKTRGRKKDAETKQAIARRQAARRAIEDRLINKQLGI